jgi:integrase
MPAKQRGEPYRLGRGSWGLRYYDERGVRRRRSGFTSRSEALDWFERVERPRQLGIAPAPTPETLSAFLERYLAAHAVGREASTIRTLRERLRHAERAFGSVAVQELERRAPEIATWTATLPERSRWQIVKAFRQALEAAVRWRLITANPARLAGPNPEPKRAEIVPFTLEEVDRLAAELGEYGPLVVFAAETGLRPSEWIALERRDIDTAAGVALVERSFAYGRLNTHGKTARSRRRVPLSARAVAALEQLPPRLDTRLVFPATTGGYLSLHNWRAREWEPALEAAGFYTCSCGGPMRSAKTRRGVRRCERCAAERPSRRVYDLRHTFAAHALAAGIGLYELARYMGTSADQIDRTYGHLVQGAEDAARAKLDAYRQRLGQDWATAAEVRASPETTKAPR